uniref:Uncharacterized protein n=1 Tax=Nelumbo nucifera TaxID=4432 RepID=A0A822Y0I7_NELNU|nr:TPA_asm: hypothetical protein HUJ06_026987 [Nelumbo nucifera]DAD25661.1 TPA_asm: hypothetical protein HUJ06_027125 [Nelumbo nucifera]
MNRLSLSGQSVDPNPRDILLFTSTSKFHLRGRQKQHQGALPRTRSGSRGACLRCGQMGHYVIERTAKILLVKEDDEERKTGEARHEHTQFAEVKRARDAVFDFGTHDCAFFAEVGSSVSSQGQQGSCSVPDVVDPGSADFSSGLILVGQIVVPLGSLQDSPGLAPGGATHSKCPQISADVEDSSDSLSV